jgi:hypothetical protein
VHESVDVRSGCLRAAAKRTNTPRGAVRLSGRDFSYASHPTHNGIADRTRCEPGIPDAGDPREVEEEILGILASDAHGEDIVAVETATLSWGDAQGAISVLGAACDVASQALP